MSIYKDEERGTWYCAFRYTDWTGKIRQGKKRGFIKKKDAQEYETTFIKQQQGTMSMPFESMYKLYMEDIEPRIRATTFSGKKYLFKSKMLPFFGTMPIDEITPPTIRKWQNSLMKNKKDFSQTYLRMLNSQLSALFNFAVRYYGLKSNPALNAGSMGKKNADSMKFWTKAEFDIFIEHTTTLQYKTIFTILFYTGMRSGELLALTFKDFDYNKKVVHITKSYARLSGTDIIGPPKTTKSKRDIALPDFVLTAVTEYTEHIYEFHKKDRLFPVTKHALMHEMRRVCSISGVKVIRVHDIRHSHASYLIEKGVSILAISERLGHDNIETTLHTYSHLYPNTHNKIANMLEENR